MRQKSVHPESPSERIVTNIRRATRKRHSSEEKIRIVLDGLRGEFSIAELCRREGIAESLYYAWSKEFLEAGKRRLAGDTVRAATNGEVKDLRREAQELKAVAAEQALELGPLKKSMSGDGGDEECDAPRLSPREPPTGGARGRRRAPRPANDTATSATTTSAAAVQAMRPPRLAMPSRLAMPRGAAAPGRLPVVADCSPSITAAGFRIGHPPVPVRGAVPGRRPAALSREA